MDRLCFIVGEYRVAMDMFVYLVNYYYPRMENTDQVLFEETQKNAYLVGSMLLLSILFGVLGIIQMGFHRQLGNHPAPNSLLIVLFIASVLGLIFFNSQKLKLRITETEISVSYGLLTGETIFRKDNISKISIRKYHAFKEFKGWGVRYGDNNESCFTVSGDDAMEIELASNEKILIGTKKPEQLQGVIDQFFSKVI